MTMMLVESGVFGNMGAGMAGTSRGNGKSGRGGKIENVICNSGDIISNYSDAKNYGGLQEYWKGLQFVDLLRRTPGGTLRVHQASPRGPCLDPSRFRQRSSSQRPWTS